MNNCQECVLVYEKCYSKYGIQKMGNLQNELFRQSNGRWKKILRIFGVFFCYDRIIESILKYVVSILNRKQTTKE
jgi:hypothetical protein